VGAGINPYPEFEQSHSEVENNQEVEFKKKKKEKKKTQ
jgi:hypothetical protein